LQAKHFVIFVVERSLNNEVKASSASKFAC
jgi:hypothetical protein